MRLHAGCFHKTNFGKLKCSNSTSTIFSCDLRVTFELSTRNNGWSSGMLFSLSYKRLCISYSYYS